MKKIGRKSQNCFSYKPTFFKSGRFGIAFFVAVMIAVSFHFGGDAHAVAFLNSSRILYWPMRENASPFIDVSGQGVDVPFSNSAGNQSNWVFTPVAGSDNGVIVENKPDTFAGGDGETGRMQVIDPIIIVNVNNSFVSQSRIAGRIRNVDRFRVEIFFKPRAISHNNSTIFSLGDPVGGNNPDVNFSIVQNADNLRIFLKHFASPVAEEIVTTPGIIENGKINYILFSYDNGVWELLHRTTDGPLYADNGSTAPSLSTWSDGYMFRAGYQKQNPISGSFTDNIRDFWDGTIYQIAIYDDVGADDIICDMINDPGCIANGWKATDLDNDGFADPLYGGNDCDDGNASIGSDVELTNIGCGNYEINTFVNGRSRFSTGFCKPAQHECNNGVWTACSQPIYPGGVNSPTNPDGTIAYAGPNSDLTCDGIDWDCDGLFDDDYASDSCYIGGSAYQVGGPSICTFGTGSCIDQLTNTSCVNKLGTCDDLGNNCSTTLDCVDSCVAGPGQQGPQTEVCGGDSLDEDCDGSVDEGFNVGQTCSLGQGSPTVGCRVEGTNACDPDNSNATICVDSGGNEITEGKPFGTSCEDFNSDGSPNLSTNKEACTGGTNSTCQGQFILCFPPPGGTCVTVTPNGQDVNPCDLSVDLNFCYIDGTCYPSSPTDFISNPDSLVRNPSNQCEFCINNAGGGQPTQWSVFPAPCDDGDSCTTNDICNTSSRTCGGTNQVHYRDDDNDGFGSDASSINTCPLPGGNWVLQGGDCDDTNDTVYPGAPELCDGLDNDCDGNTDEGFEVGGVPVGGSCGFGVGSCRASGTIQCTSLNASACVDASNNEINGPIADGVSCNDGNGCTTGEVCSAGVCQTGQTICNPDQCMQVQTCTSTSDTTCNFTQKVADNSCNIFGIGCVADGAANDANECQVCNAALNPNGWSNRNGHVCDDGDLCTINTTCQAQACPAGSQVDCSTFDTQCSVGECNPTNGQCEPTPTNEGLLCNADNNSCTDGDICQAGICQAGSNPCIDGDPATDDTCNQLSPTSFECPWTPSAGFCIIDGVTYGNGDSKPGNVCQYCDASTAETRVKWSNRGAETSCPDDGNSCTNDQCSIVTGTCTHPPSFGGSCQDGLYCNGSETCVFGVCTNSPLICFGDQCNDSTCDEAIDQCVKSPANIGNSCDDGDPNTFADQCVVQGPVGVCQGSLGSCTPGATQNCPPGATDVGECSIGTQTCDSTGNWGPCLGAQGPVAEVCGNGIDEDCNGSDLVCDVPPPPPPPIIKTESGVNAVWVESLGGRALYVCSGQKNVDVSAIHFDPAATFSWSIPGIGSFSGKQITIPSIPNSGTDEIYDGTLTVNGESSKFFVVASAEGNCTEPK